MTSTPNFEASASIAKKLKDVGVGGTVVPQWCKKEGCFWYRKKLASEGFSFTIVDINACSRRAAFDHEALAKALNDQEIEDKADKLPFDWINVSDDLNAVRFRAGEKKWEYAEGVLKEFEGEIEGEKLTPLEEETASPGTEDKTEVKFVNKTKERLSLYWIDFDKKPVFYNHVVADDSSTRSTYIGHVWRVTKKDQKEVIATFAARHGKSEAVITEDMASKAKTIESSDEDEDSGSFDDNEDSYPRVIVKACSIFVQLSKNEPKQFLDNASLDQPFDPRKVFRSRNKAFAVVYQYTPDEKQQVHLIETAPKDQRQPRLHTHQQLKAGDKRRIDRPRLYDLHTLREVPTSNELFSNPYKIRDMGWSYEEQETQECYFLYNERGHQVIRLLAMNVSGDVRTVVEETSKTFIDHQEKLYSCQVKDKEELIWASERDGWNHLYMYDVPSGKVRHQMTSGEWNVGEVDRHNSDERRIWFQAYGLLAEDPGYEVLARVNFDGSGLKILTEDNGNHSWLWSPDYKYLIDTYSRVDQAPRTVVRDAESGEELVALETGDISKLTDLDWTTPERFNALGRDNKTRIYGLITTPSHLDPTKKYPVIEHIYAGPQEFSVFKSFGPMPKTHELAELGFIVVHIDGMGTNWRGKAFHDVCYKNLKDAGLPDRIAWLKAAAQTRPWMDLSRVGIFGCSAGGQNAVSAMLWHGDFYRAAIADCGCHDNRVDRGSWSERWMGWPVDEAYEESSNVVHAGKLTGALMLIVGELDDNVDPACTMQVVNALNKAGKDYELLYVPGGGHCVGLYDDYLRRRQKDFWVRHLMGVAPPNRNGSSEGAE